MPNNPCVITAENREHYLYICVKCATTTRERVFNWLSEVSLLSAEAKSRRILVDRDIPNVVMDEQLAEALGAVADIKLGVRLAIVNRVPSAGKLMQTAVEQFGRDQPNIGFFDEIENAEKWLVKDREFPSDDKRGSH